MPPILLKVGGSVRSWRNNRSSKSPDALIRISRPAGQPVAPGLLRGPPPRATLVTNRRSATMYQEHVNVTTKHGVMPSFFACPDGEGPFPAIIF
jgi:hypothetical protein